MVHVHDKCLMIQIPLHVHVPNHLYLQPESKTYLKVLFITWLNNLNHQNKSFPNDTIFVYIYSARPKQM